MNADDLLLATEANCVPVFCIELPEQYPLVDRFYRAQGYKVKIAANESIYTLRYQAEEGAEQEIIAAVRLIPQSSGHFWLRNLLVAKHYRGRGYASQLVQHLLPLSSQVGCYCYALAHLKEFYTRLGFTLDPCHCPSDIQHKYLQYRARGRDWLLMGYLV